MSGYLGNPKLVMMNQDSIPIANFEYPTDPVATVNPVRVPVSWLNTVTGVIWVCTDNTTDANVWTGGFRGALVYPTANQTIGTASYTPLAFASEIYDTSGFHDNATNNTRLTIPAGVSKVKLLASVLFDANSVGQRILKITKSGIDFVGMPKTRILTLTATGVIEIQTTSSVLEVSAGDYFEAEAYQDSGGNLDVGLAVASVYSTWFSIEVIE